METPETVTEHMERTSPVNWSTLKAIGTSPKHYRHLLANPRADSDALLLGRVTHCLVFEEDQFDARYIVQPKFHRGQNDATAIGNGYEGGKQAAAEWDATRGTREVVKDEVLGAALGMKDAVFADPVSGPIVASGFSEQRIEWDDTQTGIKCRGRFDHRNGILADLKSTRSLIGFERDVVRYGYFSQLAWYYDGMIAAGLQTTGDPCLIAVENVEPFDVLVLTFTEDDLNVGRKVYRRCLDRLAECRRTGLWPGVSNGTARRVVLPPWADPIMEEMEVIIDGHTVKL